MYASLMVSILLTLLTIEPVQEDSHLQIESRYRRFTVGKTGKNDRGPGKKGKGKRK